ncbi:MAG: glycosyltransferase family 39 protein [Planctomycetes bacterium]|nr:glycosyltransferase family 39 protein [Planctomycetota bacterium]
MSADGQGASGDARHRRVADGACGPADATLAAQHGRPKAGHVAGLLGLCAIPLFMRLLSQYAAFTDGFYAHSALMLTRGYQPYTDFTQVAFPVLEGLLALALAAFGTSLLVVELFNRVAVLAVAFVLFLVGRRLQSGWAGALAALTWSWSTWVVHHNLFERETFVALGTSIALLLYVRSDVLDWRRAAMVAWALVIAFTLKITAVMAAAALCLHLLLRRRPREMARLGVAYAVGLAAVTGAAYELWGRPFLWQVFVFGFFRNARHDLLGNLQAFAGMVDPTLFLGLVGLVAWGLPRLRERGGALVLLLAADALYGLVISPTLWDHNMINFAPAAALLAGLWIDRGMSGKGWTPVALPAALAFGLALFALLRFGPGDPTLRVLDVRFGFAGGRERSEIAELASFVRAHSAADDVIECSEPWVAFAADRTKLVRYWDLQPVAMGVEASLAADGLAATFAKRQDVLLVDAGRPAYDPRIDALADKYVARLLACGLRWVRPLLLDAIGRHEVALVLEPYLDGLEMLTPADLRAAGYERFEERGLSGWRPADGVTHPVLHAIYAR